MKFTARGVPTKRCWDASAHTSQNALSCSALPCKRKKVLVIPTALNTFCIHSCMLYNLYCTECSIGALSVGFPKTPHSKTYIEASLINHVMVDSSVAVHHHQLSAEAISEVRLHQMSGEAPTSQLTYSLDCSSLFGLTKYILGSHQLT